MVLHIFTIHFATINTFFILFFISLLTSFTIHFATINTLGWQSAGGGVKNLQYTLLLLIQIVPEYLHRTLWNLQYTLLLLIQF